jgi:hypothetical protein
MRGGDESTTCKQSIFKIRNCHRESNARGYEAVAPNGPAIKGGCVTWRSHPATDPGTLAGKLSRWQDRYGVLFAVQVQFLLRAGAVAVQCL